MDREAKKLLTDIQNCIASINEHLQRQRNYYLFTSNKTIRRAVERELEIIGEATGKLLKMHPDIKISHARSIVDLRNLVIHAYDAVNPDLLWKIVVKDLPQLNIEVQELLKS